jgi:Cu2+-exporting ATPase
MLGDGVNDAPVLAQAQVSIAPGSGADLAHGNADAVLMGSRLAPLVAAVETARGAAAVIRQNLGWAVAYNLVALPLAAAGLLTPLGAAAGMSLSSLLVVANAMRLLPRSATRGSACTANAPSGSSGADVQRPNPRPAEPLLAAE